MPRPATTTWNWSAWWKCGRVTAPGPFSTRKAVGCSASLAGGFSSGGKVERVAAIKVVFQAVDVWGGRVLRVRMLSAIRSTAFALIAGRYQAKLRVSFYSLLRSDAQAGPIRR